MIVALDVGGSSIKSGLIKDKVVSNLTTTLIDSKANSNEILKVFASIIHGHIHNKIVMGVAIGIPGPFDYQKGISYIKGTKKYESLYGINIKNELQNRFGINLPIVLRNDAEAAIVGESVYGIGKSHSRVLGITLGTGFGSAFLVNGESIFHGEGLPENVRLYEHLWEGQTVDDLFSIRGLKAGLEKVGFHGEPRQAYEKALENDEVKHVFEVWGSEMGSFLKQHVDSFRPDVVLVLGGLSGAFSLFGKALQNELSTTVLKGQLGSKSGLLGVGNLF